MFVSRWIPNSLNVMTRSTVPVEDKKVGELLVLREPRILSLVLDVLICMTLSLLAVQMSREVKYVGMLLTETVSGINPETVVTSTNLWSSQAALRSSMRTINDRGPSRDPWDIPPQSVFQEENN